MGKETESRTYSIGNRGVGQLRPIAEALPMFHAELSKATEVALRNDQQSKDVLRRQNFLSELTVWTDLRNYVGDLHDGEVDKKVAERQQEFLELDRKGQAAMYRELVDSNEAELWGMFKEKMNFFQLLGREAGEEQEILDKMREITYRMFRHMKKTEKVREFQHMDSAADHLIVANFPAYLRAYEEMLAADGRGEAAARDDVTLRLQKAFDTMDETGKLSMSKNLREKIKQEPSMQFSSLMEDYSALIALGIIKPEKRGFIPEQTWIDRFNNASEPAARATIVRLLRYVLSKHEAIKVEDIRPTENQMEIDSTVNKEAELTEEEIFMETVTKGLVEDKDSLIENVEKGLDKAVKEYERVLRSQGIKSQEAKRLAKQRREAVFSEIFSSPDKSGFISKDRSKDLNGALAFIRQFLPTKPAPELSF